MCSVLRISKTTKDASSTNLTDLVFDSEKTYFSIKTRGNIQATISATDWDSPPPAPTVVTYNHNFGYKPRFMVFTKSYLSENYSKWAFADFVNLDFNVIHEAPGFNIEEYLNLTL